MQTVVVMFTVGTIEVVSSTRFSSNINCIIQSMVVTIQLRIKKRITATHNNDEASFQSLGWPQVLTWVLWTTVFLAVL